MLPPDSPAARAGVLLPLHTQPQQTPGSPQDALQGQHRTLDDRLQKLGTPMAPSPRRAREAPRGSPGRSKPRRTRRPTLAEGWLNGAHIDRGWAGFCSNLFRAHEGPHTPPGAPMTVLPPDSSRRPIAQRRPRWPPHGFRGLLRAPTTLQKHSQEGPNTQKSYTFSQMSRSRRFGAPALHKRAKWGPAVAPRDGPRGAQESAKTAQEVPKTAPREGPDGGPERQFRALCPKRPPGGPKRRPRGPQEAPVRPQEVPKIPPRGPREASQETPRSLPKRRLVHDQGWPQNTPRSRREAASSSSSSPLQPPPPPPPSRSPRTRQHIAPVIQCGPAE